MSKYYEVRFYTKKGGEQSWIIHVEAQTAKEAKEIAIHKWACDRRFSGMHQLYEFKSWGEALEFYKQEHKNFTIMYHFIMPEVLPF